VGEGDAILIRTPSGSTALLDGGPSPAVLTAALGRRLPPWHRQIDLLILSHPEADHITGLISVLERYNVRRVMESGYRVDTPLYTHWETLIQRKGITRDICSAGTRVALGKEVYLHVLHPSNPFLSGTEADTNNNSLVLCLEMDSIRFLLTGDIEGEAERRLVEQSDRLQCTVLKVPHHGADTSSTPTFLHAAAPQVAVISVGADNDYGHPNKLVLERLASARVNVLSTDERGSIEITTDGTRYWIRTDK